MCVGVGVYRYRKGSLVGKSSRGYNTSAGFLTVEFPILYFAIEISNQKNGDLPWALQAHCYHCYSSFSCCCPFLGLARIPSGEGTAVLFFAAQLNINLHALGLYPNLRISKDRERSRASHKMPDATCNL